MNRWFFGLWMALAPLGLASAQSPDVTALPALSGVQRPQLVRAPELADDSVYRDSRGALPGRRVFRRGQRIALVSGLSIATGVGLGLVAVQSWDNGRRTLAPIVGGVTFGLVGMALVPVSIGVMAIGAQRASADTLARAGHSPFRNASHGAYLALGGLAMTAVATLQFRSQEAGVVVMGVLLVTAYVTPILEYDGAVRGLRRAGLRSVRVMPTGQGMRVAGRF